MIHHPMIVVHIVEPFAAGIAVFVRSLTEVMPDDTHIIVHGERTQVMSASEVKKDFPSNNVRFIRWHSAQRSINPIKDIFALSELVIILRRLKRKGMVDAVHLHSSKSGLLGRAACRLTGIRNVFYTPNGASFLAPGNKAVKFFYKSLERIGDRFGGKVVCCSASELEEYLKLGIDAGYINNGIEMGHGREPIGINASNKFRVVTSGRIESQKDPVLFNEIATYFEDMPDVGFVWIGDGAAKDLFTAKNITVTGWLDNKEVHQYISASDMYLSTSKFEGLSFAVLEALSLKKPVLLSKCTGNTDLVKMGVNGGLFTTKTDAIVKILQYYVNREMLPVMGEYSEEICRTEFNVNENFKAYRHLYAGTLSRMAKGAKWSFGY
jgi:glycosyltransferase involved in cell wall biosynthesis